MRKRKSTRVGFKARRRSSFALHLIIFVIHLPSREADFQNVGFTLYTVIEDVAGADGDAFSERLTRLSP